MNIEDFFPAFELSRMTILQIKYFSYTLLIFGSMGFIVLEMFGCERRSRKEARKLVDDMILSARMECHLQWVSEDAIQFTRLVLSLEIPGQPRRHLIWARIYVNMYAASVKILHLPDIREDDICLVNAMAACFKQKRWKVEIWPTNDQPTPFESGIDKWDDNRLMDEY